MELDELIEQQVEVIGEHRPIRVACDLHRIPRIELAIDLPGSIDQFALERADLIAHFRRFRLGTFELTDLFLEPVDRLFEL